MTETQAAQDTIQPQPKPQPPKRENRDFADLFVPMIGKVITIVSPESLEDAPVGRQVKSGTYRAKLMALGNDFISIMTEYQHRGNQPRKEPAKQFIPLSRVKRLSMMKTELILHI